MSTSAPSSPVPSDSVPSRTAPPPPTASSGSRIGSVLRLHFANPMPAVVVPAIVLGGIFAVNLVIWWIVLRSVPPEGMADARDGLEWNGATFYLFVYMLVVAVMALHLPRRGGGFKMDWLGTLLMVVATASLIVMSTWGGHDYAWSSPQVIGLGVVERLLGDGPRAAEVLLRSEH